MTKTVLVIGNCDGVHRGHQALLREAGARSQSANVEVVTFWPHPMTVVRPDLAPMLLCDLEQRIELLHHYGASKVHVINFNEELSEYSPELFIDRVLRPLQPDKIVVGENFRFGHRALGDWRALQAAGVDTVGVSLVFIDGKQVSSTNIRQALAAGRVAEASSLLGRAFRLSGTVVEGFHRGRQLGFPTANVQTARPVAVPKDGVYAGWTTRLDQTDPVRWPAAISVGTNPTFAADHRTVESYVLDRDDLELYGAPVAIDFVHRLRDMVKFDSRDELVAQMGTDVEMARQLLNP